MRDERVCDILVGIVIIILSFIWVKKVHEYNEVESKLTYIEGFYAGYTLSELQQAQLHYIDSIDKLKLYGKDNRK